MDFVNSQEDMRISYYGGATGILASGLVWGVAGIVGVFYTHIAAMLALFFGGIFIPPMAILFSKLLKCSGQHNAHNQLKRLAFENLPILFTGLFIGFVVAQFKPSFFFAIMLMIIGARYFLFQTLYGLKSYWVLGATLIAAGMICVLLDLPFITGAFMGAVIEIIFSVVVFKQTKIPTTVVTSEFSDT